MENTPLSHIDRTPEARLRVAKDIYAEISRAVQRLLEVEQLSESHSRVSELRGEQEIARRALAQLENPELTAQAA